MPPSLCNSSDDSMRGEMKRLSLIMICALTLLFGSEQFARAQTKPGNHQSGQSRSKPKIVAVNTNELEVFPYDAGRVKFITSSEDTSGACAVVELTEMPGYKTAWHQHNSCEEAFYVVEGTLTIQIADKTYEFPTGSYVLIPRGTPHGQGNFGTAPVRLLTTFTPGGFDHFFRDRVDLFKKVKPGDPSFQKRFDELRAKHRKWVEILGAWNLPR
jgi:quercetin dioxygenase-like cupin family protein